MIYEVEVSEQADSDLRGIFEYIAFELQSPENASRQLDRLEEQILSLDTMPERYRKYEKAPWKSRGLRVLPVDNYVVLYIPDRLSNHRYETSLCWRHYKDNFCQTIKQAVLCLYRFIARGSAGIQRTDSLLWRCRGFIAEIRRISVLSRVPQHHGRCPLPLGA